MKVLLDTNIILDALQARKPWAKDAKEIFLLTADKRFESCITAKAITDIYYLSHHALHDNEKTKELVTKLFTLFHVVDTSAADAERALLSVISDYEDAVMVETALREKCDVLVSRDKDDLKKAAIPVESPDIFLQRFVPERGKD